MTRTPSLKFNTPNSLPPRQHPEARLQQAVVQYLMLTGKPGVFWLHPANEGRRAPRTGAFLKRIGMRKGAPDLIIFAPGGKVFCLELKAKGGKPTPDQVAFAADCVTCSIPYVVVDNLDDAVETMLGWEVLKTLRDVANAA